jgi:murein L,D-transpeptidase YcbB/YkuD
MSIRAAVSSTLKFTGIMALIAMLAIAIIAAISDQGFKWISPLTSVETVPRNDTDFDRMRNERDAAVKRATEAELHARNAIAIDELPGNLRSIDKPSTLKAIYQLDASKSNLAADGPVQLLRLMQYVVDRGNVIRPLSSSALSGEHYEACQSVSVLLNCIGVSIDPQASWPTALDRAIRSFQQDQRIRVDGQVGPETLTRLRQQYFDSLR